MLDRGWLQQTGDIPEGLIPALDRHEDGIYRVTEAMCLALAWYRWRKRRA